MNPPPCEHLLILAGRGAYPKLLAESARAQGVRRLSVIAFRGETDPEVARLADDAHWIHVGQFGAFMDAVRTTGAHDAVMAGQITPTSLFRVRMDRAMFELLAGLKARNAHTIFGAVGDRLTAAGVTLRPAHLFMEKAMPAPGLLARRPPDERERSDIEIGRRVARATSAHEVGQTVVVKEGTILAVEAFEGTDAAIRRGADLGGPGIVVVKTAKIGHDMRFDIPVIGLHTLKILRKVRASALAVEAGRTILLERERIVEEADRMNLCLLAYESGGSNE